MFIKLGIIVGIVILGGMIFSNEIDNLFPTTSATVLDSLKNDVSIFGSKASDSVEQRIDSSIDKIVDKTNESISDEISDAGNKISDKISETKESSQKTIKEEISNFNPIESIQSIFTGGFKFKNQLTRHQLPNQSTNNVSYSKYYSNTYLILYPYQPNNNPMIIFLLQYVDTSGKTKSVNVM